MDPKTGQILTYVASAGGNSPSSQSDLAGKYYLNPGSSVKPYTYAAAINDHLATMDTQIFDGPVPYLVPGQGPGGGTYEVRNFVKNKGYGEQPLRVAFANSLNISAVKTEMAVQVPNLVNFWRNLGLKPGQPQQDGTIKTNNTPDSYGASLTLGGYPITLLQHASALSVFADMGTYHQPEAILSVTDANGKPVYQADPNRGARPALDAGVAFIVSSILGDDNNRSLVFGRGTPLHLPDHLAAAKTGTTENYHDGLTVGWTPDLVSALWIGDVTGGDTPQHDMTGQADGVFVAAPAWHQFMEQALKGVPGNHWYPPPPDVVRGTKGDNSWFLTGATDISNLPGDKVPSPSPGDFGVPADPGPPVPVIGGVPIGRGRPSPVPIGG
jgi:penicillin-binding protein 1A